MKASILAAGAVVVAGVALGAQQPPAAEPTPPIFRADTELVQVDVSVLDSRRRPVTGLTAADFTILEDGHPRPVEAFTAVDLRDGARATEASWAREVAPDVATNRVGETGGRLVVILMDRTIPPGQPTVTARNIARAAIDELAPGDVAAVVSTSGGVPQNFTADRARLRQAIDQRDWSTGISRDAEALPTMGKQDPLSDGRCLCGVCVLETLTRVADAVQDAPARRKLLFFIGASLIVQAPARAPKLDVGCDRLVREARQTMTDSLARSNLTVHSIDPSGLVSAGPQARAGALGGRPGQDGPAVRRQMLLDETGEQLGNQGTLRVLPDLTGGRAVMNANEPEAIVPALYRESDSYYLMAFRPSTTGASGRVRAIEVRVNRRDVDVRARRQYVVPAARDAPAGRSASASSPLTAALDGLLPATRVPMGLHVASFAAPGSARALVAISANVGEFAPERTQSGGNAATPFELVAGAYDATGRPLASARQRLELAWPATVSAGVGRRVEVLSRLDLEPGDYEIRVAAAGADGGRTGSVFTFLNVPDYAEAPLSLSHVVFASDASTVTAPPDFLADALPVVPTTQRTFDRAAGATAFVQIGQGTTRTDPLHPVALRVRIVDAADAVVRDETIELGADAFAAGRTASSRLALPVQDLPAGTYLLRLDATMGERVVGRAVRFAMSGSEDPRRATDDGRRVARVTVSAGRH